MTILIRKFNKIQKRSFILGSQVNHIPTGHTVQWQKVKGQIIDKNK